MTALRATVLIRALDEERSIGRTLSLLRDQTVALETLVVDSGSHDRTVAIAQAAGARVIPISRHEFTYGRALNAGAAQASAEIVIALSAHAFPPDGRWVERMLEPFSDVRVACACGYGTGPDGRPLEARLLQDLALARGAPFWGYTNASGAFRRDLWQSRPFREDMAGTEDKEWAWHWLHRGYLVVVDPRLAVEHGHDDEAPLSLYRRARREWSGFAAYLDLPNYDVGDLMREWWGDDAAYRSARRARLSVRRGAKLAGAYAGRRAIPQRGRGQ